MSKFHVDAMSKAVKAYYVEAGIAAQKMKRNSEIFAAEFIESENEKIKSGLRAARQTAVDAILTAEKGGIAEAEKWGELDGSKVTDDAKLLQFDISPEQFQQLVEKHKTNGTMSTLLFDYGTKRNEELREKNAATGKMPEATYPVWNIPTAQQKAETYSKFANGALNLLNLIDAPAENGMGGVDSGMVKVAVESFGQPSVNTQHLLDMI